MHNQEKDKYWYLSGETKRKMLEYDSIRKLEDLKNETIKKLDELKSTLDEEDIILIDTLKEETKSKSIKPGVKVPLKKKKITMSKKSLAVGACAMFLAGGLASNQAIGIVKNISTTIEENSIIKPEINKFIATGVNPNTQYNFLTNPDTGENYAVHWHDFYDIVEKAKKTNEDPIVAFYLVYNSLDEYCRVERISSVIDTYNFLYGTDYESVEDFLFKNSFADKKEWKAYVANALVLQKEEGLDGNNSFGR